jgi:tetratricopeptide (TPR) repeat protein
MGHLRYSFGMRTPAQPDLVTLEHALAALRKGDIGTAESVCAPLLEQNPDDPALHQLAAAIALEAGDAGRARERALSSLGLRPGHVPTLVLAGRAARLAGDSADALTHFRRAVQEGPDRADAAFLLCRTLLEQQAAEATALLHTLLARFPDDASGWRMIGDSLHEAGQHEAALVAYARSAAVLPSAALEFRCGAILQALGRFREAINRFQAAESLAPGTAEIALRLAQCQKQALDPEGAAATLEALLKRHPESAEAWFALGLLRQDESHYEQAIAAYDQALRVRSDLPEAAVNLGICHQARGNLALAKKFYGDALALRADTFGRITQALSASNRGEVWLDHDALRRSLAR